MSSQNQIKRTLSQEDSMAYLGKLFESNNFSNGTELIRRVGKELNFFDTRGQMQISGCMKALRELEGKVNILAPSQHVHVRKNDILHEPTSVPQATNVPSKVEDFQNLELILVKKRTTDMESINE